MDYRVTPGCRRAGCRWRLPSRLAVPIASVVLLAIGLLVGSTPAAYAATVTVTNASDSTSTGDGVSLREAISAINAGANSGDVVASGTYGTNDTIIFAVTGSGCVSGVCTIVPTTNLPTISKTVVIDGYSQPSATANTNGLSAGDNAALKLVLSGSSIGAGGKGLTISATNVVVKGLVIGNFQSRGIEITSTATGTTIQGNFIGVNVNGTTAIGNVIGVLIDGTNTATIGGTTAAARNVISGNSNSGVNISNTGGTGALVQGNYIGTDATGTTAVGNGANGSGFGIFVGAPNATIGGTVAGAGNLISGNSGIAIAIQQVAGTQIQGNLIGTNAAGTGAVPNGTAINGNDATNAVIGGATAGARNVISGNTNTGISLSGSGVALNAQIKGNYIGTSADGTAPLPNLANVAITVPNVAIGGIAAGEGNIIAFSQRSGVSIIKSNATPVQNVSVRGNSIHTNAFFGIELIGEGGASSGPDVNDLGDPDEGGNHLQNYPVLTSTAQVSGLTQIVGTLNSTAGTQFALDFYANSACNTSNFGEGRTYLGSTNVTTDGSGNVSFTASGLAAVTSGGILTATATDPQGNTSEFSRCLGGLSPGVSVNQSGGTTSVTEGGATDTIAIALTSQPTANVTITMTGTQVTTSPSPSLTFTTSNWDTAQTVTITAIDDTAVEGQHFGSIAFSVASADTRYNNLAVTTLTFIVNDNDAASCSPRPPVTITTARNSDGRLSVTVTATTISGGAPNRLSQIQFEAGTNANVQIPGQATRVGPFTFDVPGQPQSFTFFVGRQAAGATTLPFRVIDGCSSQPWRTFVGGGPGAF